LNAIKAGRTDQDILAKARNFAIGSIIKVSIEELIGFVQRSLAMFESAA